MRILFTGIGDEGADDLKGQIALHRELGWNSLELRSVDGENICEMADEKFREVQEVLEKEGIQVIGFASSIANWSRPITGPFETDRQDLLRAVPRMHRLGTRYLRVMSYTRGTAEPEEWARESIRRLRILTEMAEDSDIVLIHENCDGWGSASPANLERLLEAIPSASLKVVFDMGNPLGHGHPEQAVWEFLRACGNRIVHIHIKDCFLPEQGEAVHCFPGEGQCHVYEIVKELVRNQNYRGYVSIEPHMVMQFHKGAPEGKDTGELKKKNYLSYGKKTMALLSELNQEGFRKKP